MTEHHHHHHVFPWWKALKLISPWRRRRQNPDAFLAPHIKPGMKVLDFGCAIGFFTLPAARLVGPQGRVLALDAQDKMIAMLRRHAAIRRLGARIDSRPCPSDTLGLRPGEDDFDVALAMHVMHEVPDAAATLREFHEALRPGGKLLLAEPGKRVTATEFEDTVAKARAAGFTETERYDFGGSRAVTLTRG